MTTIENALQKLASEYTHGYGPTPIPNQIDKEIEFLIDAVTKDTEAKILPEMNETHGFVLLAYAERMASLAVRENDVDILSRGLTSLSIASKLVYIKEVLPVLALLYHSASKLGIDLLELLSALNLDDDDELTPYIKRFPNRSTEDRSIQAMGYVEGDDGGGFRYVRTW